MMSRRKALARPGRRGGGGGGDATLNPARWLSARPAHVAVVALALVTIVGCAKPSAITEPQGLTKDHLCDRFLQDVTSSETVEVRAGDSSPRSTASSAEQFRETARQLAEFGASARGAIDPEIADRATRLEEQARKVLRDLAPNASDEEAQRATRPMFTDSAALYYDCAAHLFGSPGAPADTTSGACAEPDARTLDGRNVVHYGSGGYDFIDSTCELVQGTHTDGGCSFPGGTATSDATQNQAFAVVEVAYDPDTCQALHETGRIDADALP